MSASAIITVGAPMLPDLPRYTALLSEAIDAAWLTNGGVLHQRLEMALAADLPGRTVGLAASGTTALMMALQLGDLPPGAEVITPAISFAATAQVIRWCGFQPVFVDVQPDSLNICPDAVRAAITPRTAAIMPVHLLGQPCDTDALADIARQHRLWLGYDAAHATGCGWSMMRPMPMASHGRGSRSVTLAMQRLFRCMRPSCCIRARAGISSPIPKTVRRCAECAILVWTKGDPLALASTANYPRRRPRWVWRCCPIFRLKLPPAGICVAVMTPLLPLFPMFPFKLRGAGPVIT
nr:aminotransferase class I/II-fold pyridoxal phosphate-dependent enzyme [Ketogulonicigenium vulgare]